MKYSFSLPKTFLLISILAIIFSGSKPAGEAPAEKPFEYFARPFTAIGVYGGPEASMITPEGYVSTGIGTLRFYTTEKEEPVVQKVKTLRNGYLPVVDLNYKKDLDYTFEFFAANKLNLNRIMTKADNFEGTAENILNFVKVKITNTTGKPQQFVFTAGLDFSVNVEQLQKFYNTIDSSGKVDETVKSRIAACTFEKNTNNLLLGSEIILSASEVPVKAIPNTGKGEFRLTFSGKLAAGQSKEIVLKMPYWPVPKQYAAALSDIDSEPEKNKTIAFWDSIYAQLPSFEINEGKVSDVYKAGIMYMLTSGLKIIETPSGTQYIQHVNSFQYDSYFIRDAAKFIRTYDYLGMHNLAEKEIFYLLNNYQTPDGTFASHPGQHDGIGQAMWACGQHFVMTHETLFARKAFPYMVKAVDWLSQHRAKNGGIIARTSILDNELVQNGRYLGHNIWALMGMKSILPLAGVVSPETMKKWNSEYLRYQELFLTKIDSLVQSTNGLITPSFEGFDGYAPYTCAFGKSVGIDWGNLMIAYPSGLLAPDHKFVTSSMKVWKNLFRENLFLYPVHMDFASLHHYNTQYIAGTMLMRNEQEDVLDYLYKGYLVHTTATNCGPEGIEGTMKDFGHVVNITPHGQSALRYIWMLREMIVREDSNSIHLISCISPEWFKKKPQITVKQLATAFGTLNLKVEKTLYGLVIIPEMHSSPGLKSYIVHIPFWIKPTSILADGKIIALNGKSSFVVASKTRKIEIRGNYSQQKEYSYRKALEDYKSDKQFFNNALNIHKSVKVAETANKITIDGKISAEEWEGGSIIKDFTKADERASQPQQKTTVHLARQKGCLVAAFHCEDHNLSSAFPSIWAHGLVAWCIEKEKAKNQFYVVAVDINNKTEVFEYNRNGYGWITPAVKLTTLEGLKTSVTKSSSGYEVEMQVPVESKDSVLKLNLIRNDANSETIFNHSVWQFTGYHIFAFEHYGDLVWQN